MTESEILALVIQTAILVFTIVGVAVRGERRITKLETKVEHIERISGQVPGISRAVARLEGNCAANGKLPLK